MRRHEAGRRGSGIGAELAHLGRYVRSAWRYCARTETAAETEEAIRAAVAARAETFLSTLEHAVYRHPESPYHRLLAHAEIELGDVAALVRCNGVEAALEKLHAAGVYVSLDEFKGRTPIQRPGLELAVREADFDNPLGGRHFEGRSGGSSGAPRPILVDLRSVAHDARHYAAVLAAFDLWSRPTAIWYPLPPGVAGLWRVLFNVRLGRRVDEWFGQSRLLSGGSARAATIVGAAYAVARVRRRPFPFPSHTPTDAPMRVARWLAAKRSVGAPGLLGCTPSSGVRVCTAAQQAGLDIAGSVFWFAGEPYTPGKARIVERAGARAFCQYNMSEAGVVGDPCAAAVDLDEVHIASDKVAVIGRTRSETSGDGRAALLLTTLRAATSKVMLNVETGDAAVLASRRCGCRLDGLGLATHASGIRSYEKLTSEGMSFAAAAVHGLLEEALPHRFGGGPNDYQLVEEEIGGLSRIRLVVDPAVGHLDEHEILGAVRSFLESQGRPEGLMAQVWEEAGTIRLERAKPHVTAAGKVLPLVVRTDGGDRAVGSHARRGL